LAVAHATLPPEHVAVGRRVRSNQIFKGVFYIEFSIKVQICQMAARITRDNFFFFDSCENSTVKVKKQNLISDRPEYGNT
jgi:hypothetical protein